MRSSTFLRSFISVVGAICLFIASTDLSAAATFIDMASTVLGPNVNYGARSASLADIDKDGDLDLFFQGGGTSSQRLWLNNVIGTGAHTFTDITSTLLPSPTLEDSWSAAWGDYDGDGRIDVFVGQDNNNNTMAGISSGFDKGDVFKNNWPAPFTNTSVATGLNDPNFHQNVAWSDIDNVQGLDLIIGMEGPQKHQIYLQDPASQFTPVGAAVGIQNTPGNKSYGMAIGDYDGDGDKDIFISTCDVNPIRDSFFKNMLKESGSLSFVDIAGVDESDPTGNGTQSLQNSYGAEFVDMDDDGDLDLFVVGADGAPTRIFRNNGAAQNFKFTDVDTITGHPLLSDTGGDLNGARAVDYDNDGDLDLFFHNNVGGNIARKLYLNEGNWKFTDVTVAEGINATVEGAYDSAWGDIDLDGDQDLIAPNTSSFPERVFISNASTNGNHWLYVRLAGPTDNTTGIGASLYATLGDGTPQERTLRREANTNAGTFNQSDLPVHFGLGAATLIDQLRIQWPDGSVQNMFDVATNQYLTIQYLPGDYNGDRAVDAADYVAWRDGMGTLYTQADYDVWRAHFGQTDGSGSLANAAVPEPASLALFLAGIFTTCVRRRRVVTRR